MEACGLTLARSVGPSVEVAARIDRVTGRALLQVGPRAAPIQVGPEPWSFEFRALARNAGLMAVARSVWRGFLTLQCLELVVHALQDGSAATDGWVDLDSSVLASNAAAAEVAKRAGLGDQVDLVRLGIDYVPLLAGDIGIVGVGAGETMAVVDLIAAAGRRPADFCDISRALTPEGIRTALRLVGGLPGVRCILFNIFGGITRVDWVGDQLVAALAEHPLGVPVVFRLEGNGATAGRAAAAAAGHVVVPTLQAAIAETVARAGA